MKKTIKNLAIVALVAFTAFSFKSMVIEKKEIKTDASKLEWKGYKFTGSHNGTVDIKSGFLSFEGDKLVGGEFTVDMTSLVSLDAQGGMKDRLEGHLKSDDFFGVEKFPTSTLVFNKVESSGKNAYTVTADLTIKGITNPVIFKISVYGSKATASMKVDRTLYDIKFRSGSFFENLQDQVIYDEFDLVADLQF
ncbi:YceI family protein [Flavobacteriaceae bacterium XHP0103]|uniref:YceI family protein n=1 Tax=Marixanthotalea marina TaxID=2844359 RepID=UPI002989F282|nr:YceI family protein [Marixanthotalea marina]MBU3821599.1 YceI family protein [Marixanthotalea marina]